MMLQPRLFAPLRALGSAIARSTHPIPRLPFPLSSSTSSSQGLLPPRTTNSAILSNATKNNLLLPFSQVRHASHATQGTANRHSRDPAGKRLGAKRAGGEYVVPGCIIFRQRGTKWFPGENCAMGRDHTIYAAEAGYVRYYLDPQRHPDRKYIGIVFEKEGKLPSPRNAPTRRKLNRVAVPRIPETAEVAPEVEVEEAGARLRPGYMYREANWQIGRAAEKAGITAKEYSSKNRWLAWRKREARAEKAAQMKSLKNKKKASKKAKR